MAPDAHNFTAYYGIVLAGSLFLPVNWTIKLFVWISGASCFFLQFMAANIGTRAMSNAFMHLYVFANGDFQFILIFVVFMSLVIWTNPKIDTWLNVLCVIALIEVIRVSGQRLGWDLIFIPMGSCKSITVAAGSHGNIGWTGMALAMCAPGFFRKRLWIGLIPLAGALYIMKSLTPVIALGAAIILFALVRFKKKAAFGIIGAVLLSVWVYSLYDPLTGFAGGWDDRIISWSRAWDMILGKWVCLIGFGLGSWLAVFPTPGISFHRAHCEPIQVYFELGLVGVLALLLYGRYLIKRFLDEGRGRAGLFASCGMVTVIMCSLGNFPFRLAGTAIIAVAWMGIFEVATRKGRVESSTSLILEGQNGDI